MAPPAATLATGFSGGDAAGHVALAVIVPSPAGDRAVGEDRRRCAHHQVTASGEIRLAAAATLATGFSGVPMPMGTSHWPSLLRPQQATEPSRAAPRRCARRRSRRDSPACRCRWARRTGRMSLYPQQATEPSVRTATVWKPPAGDARDGVLRRADDAGHVPTPPLPLYPQRATEPSVRTATVW